MLRQTIVIFLGKQLIYFYKDNIHFIILYNSHISIIIKYMVSGDLKIWNYDFFSHYCVTLETIKKKKMLPFYIANFSVMKMT